MRLKERPEDFRVEEVSSPPPLDADGEFVILHVEKRGVAAFDALASIARALKVPPEEVAFAGLKDIRSDATQLASVRLGGRAAPRSIDAGPGVRVKVVGRAARAVRSDDIERNRFTMVVRDVSEAALFALPQRIEAVRRTGVPNYFDDQRFGGASPARGFIAEAWSKGDWRRALELLIARPSPKDPRRERLEKKKVSERWGRWTELAGELKGDAAPIVKRLAQAPDDLAGAFLALDARFRSLLVSQYQSYLWNEAAAAEIRAALPREQTFDVMYRCGTLVLWRAPDEAAIAPLRAKALDFAAFPMPAEVGVPVPRGTRALTLVPAQIGADGGGADELHPGRRKVILRLELPRASYATVVAKRLFYEP